jgi:hypothetical protein
MSIRDKVMAKLQSEPGLVNLCKNFYHQQLPQNIKYPCIYYECSALYKVADLQGASGLQKWSVQFVCMSMKTGVAEALQEIIHAWADKVNLPDKTKNFEWIFHDDSAETIDKPANAAEKAARQLSVTLTMWIK